jgi:hypothetical protein
MSFNRGDKVTVTNSTYYPTWTTNSGYVVAFDDVNGQALVFLRFQPIPASFNKPWGFYPKWVSYTYLVKA